MAAVFDQLLGTNQSKTAGTSISISPSSKTVTVGKTIFLAYAGDDAGSAFGVSDNLGNVYTLQKEHRNVNSVKTQLWSAPVTVGGSITTITISWTTNVTAKAVVAGEYSGFGTLRVVSGGISGGTTVVPISNSFFTNELWIAAIGVEDDIPDSVSGTTGTPAQTLAECGKIGTSGGGSATNISVTLGHILITANSTSNGAFTGTASGSQDQAGAGAIYNAIAGGVTEADGNASGSTASSVVGRSVSTAASSSTGKNPSI